MRVSPAAAVLPLLACFAACNQQISPTAPPAQSVTSAVVDATGGTAAAAANTASPDALVPFKGTFEGRVTSSTPLTPPLISAVIEATGTATHLGRFTLQIPHVGNPAIMMVTGTYVFTAANGDTLTGEFTGRGTLVAPGVLSTRETVTITGGTGRFAGATGSFTTERTFTAATGVVIGTFEGEISSVGTNKH